jgi:hypothetical protein
MGETTQRLPIRWQDSHPQGDDDSPTYGAYETSFSQETVLARLADILKTQDIKALGILASDPWDLTFLIHWFKQSSPNIRLFVRDPDLLYRRTPDVGSIAGVLAVNNYPLITESQLSFSNHGTTQATHSGTREDLLTFASSSQEAQYDAFLEVLERITPMIVPPHHKRIGWRSQSQGLPLWLAATGTSGYFPLKFLPKSNYTGQKEKIPNLDWHSLNVGKPPYSAVLAWSFLAILGILHAVFLISRKAPPVLKHEFDFSDLENPITSAKRLCHVITLLTLSLAALITGSSFLFLSPLPSFLSSPLLFVFGLVQRGTWRGLSGYGVASIAVIAVEILLLAVAFVTYTRSPFQSAHKFAQQLETQPFYPGRAAPDGAWTFPVWYGSGCNSTAFSRHVVHRNRR